MKNILAFIFVVALIAIVAPQSAEAQFSTKKVTQYTFTTDTIADTGTGTFEWPYRINGKSTITWVINATQLSGTADFTVTRRGSARTAGADWVTFYVDDPVAIDTLYSASVITSRELLLITGKGSSSTKLEVSATVIEE